MQCREESRDASWIGAMGSALHDLTSLWKTRLHAILCGVASTWTVLPADWFRHLWLPSISFLLFHVVLACLHLSWTRKAVFTRADSFISVSKYSEMRHAGDEGSNDAIVLLHSVPNQLDGICTAGVDRNVRGFGDGRIVDGVHHNTDDAAWRCCSSATVFSMVGEIEERLCCWLGEPVPSRSNSNRK